MAYKILVILLLLLVKPLIPTVVNISNYIDKKIEVLMAYKSQFYNPESEEPTTPISGAEFFNYIKGRMLQNGRYLGVDYAEGFTVARPIGVEDITELL